MSIVATDRRLRILMLSNLCPPDYDGGFELRAFQLARALRERGHDVQLVTSGYRPTYEGPRDDPTWVHRILRYVEKGESGIAKLTRFLAVMPESLRNSEALDHYLDENSFDLAYLFGLHRIGLATHGPVVRRGIPVLWHAGDAFLAKQLYTWPQKAAPYRWILKTLYKTARDMEEKGDYRHVAFVSENLREFYSSAGLVPEESFVIPRPVDFPLGEDLDRPRSSPPLFFQACRLHEQKGPHLAIAAAASLAKRRPDLDWRLEIAGKAEHPSYRDRLLGMISDAGLGERVELIGQISREEAIQRMRSATALIHASTFDDPFANTIVEALGAGTPLIGSNVGSILEVVKPEESALVFKKGDVDGLSRHMERILTDPQLARKLSAHGIGTVKERYTLERVLDQTEQAFRTVLNKSAKEQACT